MVTRYPNPEFSTKQEERLRELMATEERAVHAESRMMTALALTIIATTTAHVLVWFRVWEWFIPNAIYPLTTLTFAVLAFYGAARARLSGVRRERTEIEARRTATFEEAFYGWSPPEDFSDMDRRIAVDMLCRLRDIERNIEDLSRQSGSYRAKSDPLRTPILDSYTKSAQKLRRDIEEMFARGSHSEPTE